MATTISKVQCKLLLDNGTDAQGNVKTVSVSYPSISPTGYTDAKALAIATAAEDCLTKSVYSVQKITYEAVSE